MKKKEHIRILVVNTVGLNRNGITQVIFDYYLRFDPQKYDIHVVANETDDINVQHDFEKAGLKIQILKSRKKETSQYILGLYKLMLKNKYSIIHVHGNSATMVIELFTAKVVRCPVRIAHVHNSTCDAKRADKLLRPIFYWSYTKAFACGQLAGKWMFGNREFKIVKNGRDIQKFLYKPDMRKQMRKKYGLRENTLAIGHVGNFNEQKNHVFLIWIFKAIKEKKSDAKLFLAGYGHCENEVHSLVHKLGLDGDVWFLGVINNIADVLQAMDVMVLPSKHEGLPLVVVEWQIAALPCVISSIITQECAFSNLVKFLPLDATSETWANTIIELGRLNRMNDALATVDLARKEGYDIEMNAKDLMSYLETVVQ